MGQHGILDCLPGNVVAKDEVFIRNGRACFETQSRAANVGPLYVDDVCLRREVVDDQTGIKRYVMVSSVGANPTAGGQDPFALYLRAKGLADEALVKSGLDYTIVRPTMLTDDEGDGLVFIDQHVGRGSIPRDDVAALIAEVLHQPATIGKVFEVIDGKRSIAEALGSLP